MYAEAGVEGIEVEKPAHQFEVGVGDVPGGVQVSDKTVCDVFRSGVSPHNLCLAWGQGGAGEPNATSTNP